MPVTQTEFDRAITQALKDCAMELVEGNHVECINGVYHTFEVWKCPECEATYLYDTICTIERMTVRYVCPCGRVYEFDADKPNQVDAQAVMPRLISGSMQNN